MHWGWQAVFRGISPIRFYVRNMGARASVVVGKPCDSTSKNLLFIFFYRSKCPKQRTPQRHSAVVERNLKPCFMKNRSRVSKVGLTATQTGRAPLKSNKKSLQCHQSTPRSRSSVRGRLPCDVVGNFCGVRNRPAPVVPDHHHPRPTARSP